jgi:ATP-binding cassette subfamily B protein
MTTSASNDWALVRRLLRDAKPYAGRLAVIFVLSLISAPLALLTPVPLKIAVDHVLGTAELPAPVAALLPTSLQTNSGALLGLAAVLVVVIALLQNLEGYGSWLLQLYTGEKLALDLRAKLLVHAQRLSLRYHDTRGVSDSIYRIQYDAPAVQYVIIQGLLPLITSLIAIVSMLAIVFWLSWQLALVALTVVPALAVLSEIYRRRVRRGWEDVKRRESEAMAVVHETLGALRVVKAFGQERTERDRFVRHASLSLARQFRVVMIESGFGIVVGIIVAAGTAGVLYLGVEQVRVGALTLGSLLMIMSYLAQLYKPVETMSKKIASLQSSMASGQRAAELLDEAPDVPEAADARSLGRATGDIEFRQVTFRYSPDRPVLEGVNFAVPAGSKVGISGKTGSGKTTLASLLPRFYDPVQGSILLDGIDLRDYRLDDLRRQFAIVLQEPVLFSTSIADNIAYGRPGATREQIEAAARAANAHDFIVKLPEGYDTEVGERGVMLSGGERQRVSLARAFLKDAPILILDEPTSSVDVRSEAAILQAMERLMAGRTTFMIAHRLNTLETCDIRLHFHDGRLTRQTATSVQPSQPE